MSWLFKHKLLALVIFAGIFYWWINPSGQFGYYRKGLVIYNKIPVALFDCYISTNGKLYLESDLKQNVHINYWMMNHFSKHGKSPNANIPLIVGTGFDGAENLKFNMGTLIKVRHLGYEPEFCSSSEAINRYNILRTQKKDVAILLKVK